VPLALISLGLGLKAAKTESHAQAQKEAGTTQTAPVKTLTIGFQKSSLNFLIANNKNI
jgi:sulfonate transport system substrate-binding protein